MVIEIPRANFVGAARLYVEYDSSRLPALAIARDMCPDFHYPFRSSPQWLIAALEGAYIHEGTYQGDRFTIQSYDSLNERWAALMYGGHTPSFLILLRRQGIHDLKQALIGER